MKLLTALGELALIHAAVAHTLFTTLSINNVSQEAATCVRMPMTPNNASFPINDLDSDNMACGYDGTKGVARVCSVPQAAKLDFLFVDYPDNSQPGAIDPSHKGPCAVYMKRVNSPATDDATGDGWFKIWDEGYDNITSQWCVDKLIKNNGSLSANIPSSLAGGYYLVRPEILALHQADKSPPNPQFYVGCTQIFLESTAKSLPRDTVNIPGYTNISDPSVLFNIYVPKWPYKTPGPATFNDSSSSTIDVKPVEVQTEGLLPLDTILTNANWWAVELDSYSDQDGCLNATQACWKQATDCYNTAPPTGSRNCRIWENKCDGIHESCNAGNYSGPPDEGKKLIPGLNLQSTTSTRISPLPSTAITQSFSGIDHSVTVSVMVETVVITVTASTSNYKRTRQVPSMVMS